MVWIILGRSTRNFKINTELTVLYVYKLGEGGESRQVGRVGIPPFMKKCLGWATINYSNLPLTHARTALEKYQHDCPWIFCVINGWSFWPCFRKFVSKVCSHFLNFAFRIFQSNFDTAPRSISRSHSINMKLQTLFLNAWGAQRLEGWGVRRVGIWRVGVSWHMSSQSKGYVFGCD